MNKTFYLFFLCLLFFNFAYSQSPCDPNGIHPFCTDDNPYGVTYQAGTTGSADVFFGPDGYACLWSYPAPAYYYMRIAAPGDLLIYIEQFSSNGQYMLDVDFACWGPFQANSQQEFIQNLCSGVYQLDDVYVGSHFPPNGYHNPNDPSTWGGYPVGNLVDCSYDPSEYEWCYIPYGQTGEFYLLVLTNYSQEPGFITFSRNSASSATTDCSLLAPVTNNGPLCEGETLYLTCQNAQPGATYQWTGPNGWTSNVQNPIIQNVTAAMAGEYQLVMTYDGATATASTTVVITPEPNIVITPAVQHFCDGDSVTFTASGGDTYQWSNGATTPSITVNPSVTTVYTVTGSVQGGCTATASATAEPGAGSAVSLPDAVCSGNPIRVTPNSPEFTYLWSSGETSSTIMPIVTESTVYTVTVTDAHGCTGTASVTVNPSPTANFSVNSTDFEMEDGMALAIFTNLSDGGDTWHWNFGDYHNSGNQSNEISPSYTYTRPGFYTVWMVVSTVDNCRDSVSKVITVTNPFAFYIPSAFTPNLNGLNEVFAPTGIGVSPNNYEMYIYNSYGEIIYHTTELFGAWDGKVNGQLVPADVYVYHFIIESMEGFLRKYTGTVTVIR